MSCVFLLDKVDISAAAVNRVREHCLAPVHVDVKKIRIDEDTHATGAAALEQV